ncbi:MAG: dephospho-CoA kinase [Proteobacteria bacterium]|nr:dephospho-CoA kinase [Pseudomonadota bacterium]
MKIGITGPIASGKSLVASYLSECLGIPRINADEIGHEIIETPEIKEKLKDKFGESVIVNNKVNRIILGEIVFSNKKYLTALNRIFYSPFRSKIIEELNRNDNIILEMAILHQYKLERFLDVILFVSAKKDIRLNRLMKKGLSKKEALKRIDIQSINIRSGDVLINDNFTSINAFKDYLKKICNFFN